MYSHLSANIAADPENLELASVANKDQPNLSLLLGSVHPPIASRVHAPRPLSERNFTAEKAFASLKDICRVYRYEIQLLLKNKRVQINKVRRHGGWFT